MDYLEKKGHLPVKHLSGGRLSYLCPLPWHAETKPSFVVWTNAEYENFYCFGCQAKHNIIHLVSFLDGITARQAIEKLSGGVEFTREDESRIAQEQLEVVSQIAGIHSQDKTHEAVDQLSDTLVEISSMCNSFLESIDYKETECQRIDKVWELVDSSLRDFDFEKIEKVRSEIGTLLTQQKTALREKETAVMRDIWRENDG